MVNKGDSMHKSIINIELDDSVKNKPEFNKMKQVSISKMDIFKFL